jgi:hypothetical protein
LIDFDLEAPGLHRYLTPFLFPADIVSSPPGVLELFAALSTAIDEKLANSFPLGSGESRRLDDEATAGIIDGFDFKHSSPLRWSRVSN